MSKTLCCQSWALSLFKLSARVRMPHGYKCSQQLSARVCIRALQLAKSGPPPDVVGVWVGDSDVGAIATDGSFIYKSATLGQASYI